MPYEKGETNMHDSTEMQDFKISTEYYPNCIEIGFRTEEELIVTTRKEIENLLA